MNIVCAICQDALESSNDIFSTPCGHAFHFFCLIQWLEKSQSCPECRQKVKRNQIIRLYFNFANTEVVKEDSFTLQSKIDSLSFQIKLKETELNKSQEENVKLKKQNNGLRDEVKSCERRINEKNSVIHALKEQSSYFKEKCQDYDRLEKEKNKLQADLELYSTVKTLLCSTNEEVEKTLKSTQDPASLATYICIMKRELGNSMTKRKELRSTVRRLQNELQAVQIKKQAENDEYMRLIKNLEEELVISNTEKKSLEQQLQETSEPVDENREQAEKKDENTNISRKRESDSKLNTVSSKKIRKSDDPFDLTFSFDKSNNSDVIFVSPEKNKSKENESPYLPTKSKSILSFKSRDRSAGFSLKPKQIISSSKSTSLYKKSMEESNIHFDGFGGHSKVDIFPKASENKLKRSATDVSKSKKLKLDLGLKPMDDYVVNLT